MMVSDSRCVRAERRHTQADTSRMADEDRVMQHDDSCGAGACWYSSRNYGCLLLLLEQGVAAGRCWGSEAKWLEEAPPRNSTSK